MKAMASVAAFALPWCANDLGSRTRRQVWASCASNPDQNVEPIVELEFIGPADGDNVFRTAVPSGGKVLRSVMLENKLELYGLYGKVMNCGGGGSCGTCIVEILEGKDLLSEVTPAEKRFLKKKPESWRLACQTIVGNKSNGGKVIVQRLPQQKKT